MKIDWRKILALIDEPVNVRSEKNVVCAAMLSGALVGWLCWEASFGLPTTLVILVAQGLFNAVIVTAAQPREERA